MAAPRGGGVTRIMTTEMTSKGGSPPAALRSVCWTVGSAIGINIKNKHAGSDNNMSITFWNDPGDGKL